MARSRTSFQKGNKAHGSRKGVPNRVSKDFKENVENIFEAMGGFAEALKWANKNKADFYLKVWTKLAPLQFTGQVKVDHEHEFDGALEIFSRIVAGRRAAIRARHDHLKLIEGRPSEDRKDTANVGNVRKT